MIKKITIFTAMLAMVLVLAVPALADQGSGSNTSCHGGRNVGVLSQEGATPGQIQKLGGWTASEWTQFWKGVC